MPHRQEACNILGKYLWRIGIVCIVVKISSLCFVSKYRCLDMSNTGPKWIRMGLYRYCHIPMGKICPNNRVPKIIVGSKLALLFAANFSRGLSKLISRDGHPHNINTPE